MRENIRWFQRCVLGCVGGLALLAGGCYPPQEPAVLDKTVLPKQEDTVLARGPKKRIAILPFATKAQASADAVSPEQLLAVLFGGGRPGAQTPASDTGGIAADMLTTALFHTQHFLVVERDLLDKVLQEQGLSTSGALDPNTAVKIGKLLGVQALIVGSVTQLGFLNQS